MSYVPESVISELLNTFCATLTTVDWHAELECVLLWDCETAPREKDGAHTLTLLVHFTRKLEDCPVGHVLFKWKCEKQY